MGSEMCIRDSVELGLVEVGLDAGGGDVDGRRLTGDRDLVGEGPHCLLYTSDAADERSSVDLGGRRIIKKKKR